MRSLINLYFQATSISKKSTIYTCFSFLFKRFLSGYCCVLRSRFVEVKRIILLLFVFLSPVFVSAQMSFDEGTYVRFKTLNHRISAPNGSEIQHSGLYNLTGSEIIDLGILSSGDPTEELEIRCRLDGILFPVNSASEPMGGDFSIPYDVNESILTANTIYWFYIPTSYDITYSPSTETSNYSDNAYSDAKYFLVSGGNTSFQSIPFEQESADSNARLLNARATWIYDTAMYNLVGTGRRWMGELFDFTTQRDYDFRQRTAGTSNTDNSPVLGTDINVQIRAVARANTGNTKLRVEYGNQTAQVNFPAVLNGSVSNFVQEKVLTATFTADQGSTLRIIYDKAGNNSAAMWLDEVVVDWETSSQKQSPAKFMVNAPRGADSYSYFSTEASSDLAIFGIEKNRIVSKVVPIITGTNEARWYSHEDKLRTYKFGVGSMDYVVDEVMDISSSSTSTYPDLANAHSIIITTDSLLSVAHDLADLERMTGIDAEVVSLEYIYDLMSTGNPDIGAIRKFLVRLYNDYEKLQYLTLLGDASYDYKDKLSGPKSNLIPTYHTKASFSLYSSYITDDYYGYLDAGESVNWFVDDLDIGIGRIPVRSIKQAEQAVAKIERYLTSTERFGPWRMNALWVADDVDEGWEKEFEVVQDRLTKELDTIRTELNNIKIYADAFLQESMPGSQRYPEARQKLFREVENGALLVSYVGHGGEVGWATERILQLEDINAWENQTTMPVFTTITCEFARFDDPNRVSAAEHLHLNPNGGAIALFSTTRSVFATNSTYQLNELLNRNMLFLDQPRLGDVIRTTKNNNISGDKIKFSLLGDAALPLVRPTDGLVFDSINGVAWDQFNDTIKALNWVQIKGSIRDDSGQTLADINGRVWLQFYDKAQKARTKANDNRGGTFNFTTQNNAVFKGQATLVNGEFTFEFRVPLDINLSLGSPKISAYATNFERDFWGASRQHLIGGVFDGMITDNEGPEVRLFIDDTNFVSGGLSDSDPTALGLLYDESGINAVGLGVGHNLSLILDGQPVNINDYYQSAIDDFTRGKITYPYYNLEYGQHTLELRAWDVLNQWGYDSITFVVVDSDKPVLNQLLAYPNPFLDRVNFSLSHDESGEGGTLVMDLVNNEGRILWHKEESLNLMGVETSLPGFKMSEVEGGRPGPGFYHIRVQFTRNIDGKSAAIQEKLIYIR